MRQFSAARAREKTLLVVRSGERIIKPCGLVCCVAILCPVASVALLVALCSLPRLSSRLCCHRRLLWSPSPEARGNHRSSDLFVSYVTAAATSTPPAFNLQRHPTSTPVPPSTPPPAASPSASALSCESLAADHQRIRGKSAQWRICQSPERCSCRPQSAS